MNSKLYAAQDALKNLLDDSTSLSGVTKALGTPLRIAELPEVVWISGEVEDWNASYKVTGLQAKDETFVLRVHCLATRIGDYPIARNRTKTLAQAVEETIASNPTLNDTVELAQVTQATMEESRLDDRKHIVLITLFINCRAWLNA